MTRSCLIRFRRWFVGLAMLAVLANALAPAISQAFQARQAGVPRSTAGSDWIELCSATGTLWVRFDAADRILEETRTRPADAPGQAHGAACGYCLPHAGTFALPAVDPPALWAARAAPDAWATPAAIENRHPAPVWSWPALRGPPHSHRPDRHASV